MFFFKLWLYDTVQPTRAVVGCWVFFQRNRVHHHNRSNSFPLADDLIGPYRPFVDEAVYQLSNNCIELSAA